MRNICIIFLNILKDPTCNCLYSLTIQNNYGICNWRVLLYSCCFITSENNIDLIPVFKNILILCSFINQLLDMKLIWNDEASVVYTIFLIQAQSFRVTLYVKKSLLEINNNRECLECLENIYQHFNKIIFIIPFICWKFVQWNGTVIRLKWQRHIKLMIYRLNGSDSFLKWHILYIMFSTFTNSNHMVVWDIVNKKNTLHFESLKRIWKKKSWIFL